MASTSGSRSSLKKNGFSSIIRDSNIEAAVLNDDSDFSDFSDFSASDNGGETSSESESETEVETPVVNTAESWMNITNGDSVTNEYTFSRDTGMRDVNLPVDSKPVDYFELFFNKNVMQGIVNETNKYADERIQKLAPTLKPKSTWKKWVSVTYSEIRLFIGVILNMGLINLPRLQDYFSQQ